MKILFVFASIGNLPAFENVITELCQNGHHVTVHYGQTVKKYFTDHSIQLIKAKANGRFDSGPLLIRKRWKWLLGLSRQLLNRTPYLNAKHPSPWLINRNTGFSRRVQPILDSKPIVRVLANRKVQEFMRWIERSIPSDFSIRTWLAKDRPDVIVASPCIYANQDEIEYLKAASDLGIPTVISIFSWDHLLTKGTLHLIPDWLMVWNQILANDAAALHFVPPNQIFLTGAPHFDVWFQKKPMVDHQTFCTKVGLDPAKKYVAYLCSALNSDESLLVREFANALSANPETKDLSILVRPYPSKSDIWQNFEMNNVAIWPRQGTIPNSESERDDYYHTMYHSMAVAGISTTAFLEAAVIDKPCITIMTEQYHFEHRMGHFLYLLNADFLEIAHDVSETTMIVGKIMNAEDAKAAQRHDFVVQFTRPWGKQYCASEIMAQALELIAQGKTLNNFSPQQVQSHGGTRQ